MQRSFSASFAFSFLSIGAALFTLGLIGANLTGCSAQSRATWTEQHPPAEIAQHAVPVVEGAGVLATTGNPAPLATSVTDFVKWLLLGGSVVVAGERARRSKWNGSDRRAGGRAGTPPPPPPPPARSPSSFPITQASAPGFESSAA